MTLPDFLHAADGEIRLVGHRIRLIDIAARYEEGHTPESIAHDYYPTLSLALVHKTIAFYLENEAEVRDLMLKSRAEADRLASQPTGAPSFAELRRRMAANCKTRAQALTPA